MKEGGKTSEWDTKYVAGTFWDTIACYVALYPGTFFFNTKKRESGYSVSGSVILYIWLKCVHDTYM